MIERMTEKTRANLSKEGSVLKKIRIYGGIPMAIMAGGVAMLVCMVFMRPAYYYGCAGGRICFWNIARHTWIAYDPGRSSRKK